MSVLRTTWTVISHRQRGQESRRARVRPVLLSSSVPAPISTSTYAAAPYGEDSAVINKDKLTEYLDQNILQRYAQRPLKKEVTPYKNPFLSEKENEVMA